MDGSARSLTATRVAITGASGFLGARLVTFLRQVPFAPEIIVLSRRQTSDRNCRVVDLRSETQLHDALEGCSAVVHCAFDFQALPRNVRISEAVGRAAAGVGARMVHLSTAAVHEPFPDGDLDEDCSPRSGGSDYKAIKISIEAALCDLVLKIGLDLVILQPTVVYGPQGGAWTDSPIRELLTGTVVLPDAGCGLCNAVYVDDLCQAVARALTAALPSGERILISGPAPVAWREFYGAYCDILALNALQLETSDKSVEQCHRPEAPPTGSVTPFSHARKASRLKQIVTRTLGVRTVSTLQLGVSMAKCVLFGAKTHAATGPKLELFQSRCHVRIEKAQRLLGYHPQFDLAAGMAETSGYVIARYGWLSRLRSANRKPNVLSRSRP